MPRTFYPLNTRKLDRLVPEFPMSGEVPRALYQTHSTGEMPDEILRNRDRILGMNSGWRYAFFDDQDRRGFINESYGAEVLQIYDRIRPSYGAARADLFRYLLMYRMGGVYLDIKSSATKPFDQIITSGERYVLTTWDENENNAQGWGLHPELRSLRLQECQQWHIIAVAGHPYLRRVIQRVLRNIYRYVPEMHGTGTYGVLRLTGPIAYTFAIAELHSFDPNQGLRSNKDIGLIYSIYANPEEHRRVFGVHYSTRSEPITTLSTGHRIVGGTYAAGRALYRATLGHRRTSALKNGSCSRPTT